MSTPKAHCAGAWVMSSTIGCPTSPVAKFEDGAATDSKSEVKAGWTIGAGVAYAFNKNWVGQAEYRYTDFGKVTTVTDNTDPGWEEHEHVKTNELRIGIAYKF